MKIPLGIETIVILLIDLGTDLAPAVSLAYEEPEDAIMENPPRSEHAHLVGVQMMALSYGIIGVFETFAAFFAFLFVFADYGFTIHDLVGASLEYRLKYADMHSARQGWFERQCRENQWYQQHGSRWGDGNCQQDYQTFRIEVLGEAQGAFLVSVVWAQIANILVRKTQIASIFTFKRFFDNRMMLYSIAFEILLIIMIVHVPGLNTVFLLAAPSSHAAASAVWIIPFIIIWEETRKFLIRRDRKGWLETFTSI